MLAFEKIAEFVIHFVSVHSAYFYDLYKWLVS